MTWESNGGRALLQEALDHKQELKTCPFCGGYNACEREDVAYNRFQIACGDCGASTGWFFYNPDDYERSLEVAKRRAIVAWNRRNK
jgi:Lar family restriction alleviation protein